MKWKIEEVAKRDDMTRLKSVESYFHPSTLMTYPVQTDGGFDPDDGVHIDDIMECCEEWFEGLSDSDRKTIWSAWKIKEFAHIAAVKLEHH